MKDYTLPIYYEYRNNIKKKRDKGMSWEELSYAGKSTDEGLADFLETFADANDIEEITIDDWKELVEKARIAEEETMSAQFVDTNAMIIDEGQDS